MMDSGMEYSDEEFNGVIPVISNQKRNNNEENVKDDDSTFDQCKFEEDPLMNDNGCVTSEQVEQLNPYLLSKFKFENRRKTLKSGPKSKTRHILSVKDMIRQLKKIGINPFTAQPMEGSSFVDDIYIHPNLIKSFDFKYKRLTRRSGPKCKTLKPLSMHEKYLQILEAGINPSNCQYINYRKQSESIFVHPKTFQTFPFNRNTLTMKRRKSKWGHNHLTIREMYRQIIDAGIDPITGEQFSDEEDIVDKDYEATNKDIDNAQGMDVDRDDKNDGEDDDNSDGEDDDNSDGEDDDNNDGEDDDNSDGEYDENVLNA